MIQLNFLKELPFDSNYYVNDIGEVFSTKQGKIKQMKVKETVSGYYGVTLHCKNDSERRKSDRGSNCYQVHRLVAKAWIPNPNKLPYVNHKDGNKKNNTVSNLEWVSPSQNAKHSREILKNANRTKSVIQVTLDGQFIKKYPSLIDAKRETGIDSRSICSVCQGKRRKAGNYVWFYEKNYVQGKGLRKLAQCKKIRQFTKDGVFIKEYESAKDAANAVGAVSSNISNACAGRLLTSKGYIWRYVEKEEEYDETKGWIVLERYPHDKISPDGRIFSTWGKRFKVQQDRKGYKLVSVTDINGNEKKMYVHRLVALAYIPNPCKYPCVNHKDGNPSNNNVENLEWCTHSKNTQHAHDNGLCSSKKAVLQIKGTKIIAKYDSMRKAADAVGVSASAVSHVCRGDTRLKKAGGYSWRYA